MALLHVFGTVILCGMCLKLFPGLFSYTLRCYNSLYRAMPAMRLPLLSLSSNRPPAGIPTLDVVEDISPVVIRVLGMNPGAYTLQGTNTYLVGCGDRRALIDTGERRTAPQYIPLLLQTMQSRGIRGLSDIIITHHHADHVGGVSALLDELAKHQSMHPLPIVHQHVTSNSPTPSYSYVEVCDGEVIELQGATLEAMHSPGHTSDHITLLLRTSSSAIDGIFTGDCVLGCGSAVFDDLFSYMASLASLLEMVSDPSSNISLFPGHGPVISAFESLGKVKEYISHRLSREQQIVSALQTVSPMSSWQLMTEIYPPLPLLVRMSAQWNVLHHLEKLKKEGKVAEQWPDMWKIIYDP